MKTEGTPIVKRIEFSFNCHADKIQNKKTLRGNFMKNYVNLLFKQIVLASFIGSLGVSLVAQEVEEVVVTAEKRSESLQDISQAVTALTESDIEEKNITSFVDLSAIVPGVTVAKNEGYKTIISIRGVGNETNQNAIAAPSVAYHMDGVFIASPFALGTDFLDVERIEVLRGPQGTLFGQNSTGGAVNVISRAPTTEGAEGKLSVTFGDYNLKKVSTSNNFVVSDKIASRFSISSTEASEISLKLLQLETLGMFIDSFRPTCIATKCTFEALFCKTQHTIVLSPNVLTQSGSKKLTKQGRAFLSTTKTKVKYLLTFLVVNNVLMQVKLLC
mgnify:CR=1 FL=1